MFIYIIKYLPDDIYIVSIVSGLSSFGFLLQGPMTSRFNQKWTLLFSYLLICIVLVTLMLIGSSHINEIIYALITLAFRSLVCLNFGTLYVYQQSLFESSFVGKSYAFCNIVSMVALTGVPMIAEVGGI